MFSKYMCSMNMHRIGPLLLSGIYTLVARKGTALYSGEKTFCSPELGTVCCNSNTLSVQGYEAHLQSRPVAGCMAGCGETNQGVSEL